MNSQILSLVAKKELPDWLSQGLQYEVYTGSHSTGTNTPESDTDIIAWAVAPPDLTFVSPDYLPHFDPSPSTFRQINWRSDNLEITIYSAERYADLLYKNNPNLIESLFVGEEDILHCTDLGDILRSRRRMLINLNCIGNYRNYSISQIRKTKKNKAYTGKRAELVATHGFDVKSAAHSVRLMSNLCQILEFNEIELKAEKELLSSIRNGNLSFEEVIEIINDYELKGLSLVQKFKNTGYSKNELRLIVSDIIETAHRKMGLARPDTNSSRTLRKIKELLDHVN